MSRIDLFNNDKNFTINIIPHLMILKIGEKEILYREDDPAEEGLY